MKKTLMWCYTGLVLLFLYVPVILVSVYSFNVTRSTTVWGGFSLDWYVKLFQNASVMKAFTNSLLLALSTTVVATVLGTLGSLGLYRYKTKFGRMISPLTYIPVLTPEIIIGFAFMQLFSYLGMKFGAATLFISHLSFCVPFVLIVVSARLEDMPRDLEEAARDLGASRWKAFFTVTLPEIMPGILSGAALAFVMSFDDVVISFFMVGASSTTLPVKVYSMMKVGVSPEINALSTVILVITLTIVCIAQFRNRNIFKKLI